LAKLASFKSTFGGGIGDSAESEESDKADADAERLRVAAADDLEV
jgi:hypothetical protein